MLATHKDAEQRYSKIRGQVLQIVNKDFKDDGLHNLEATVINQFALNECSKWGLSDRRRVKWDWVVGYPDFKFSYPKRFEMALWHKGKLVSLSLGRPTYNGLSLRLDFVEGNPERASDVKVFQATFAAMVIYADSIGAKSLRIMNPVNAQVRKYYESFGLNYVAKGDYLEFKL